MRPMRAAMRSPEFAIALFALLVNLPWELAQIPFFRGMSDRPHGEGVRLCTTATLGDALITVLAYELVAALRRARHWLLNPTRADVRLFVAVGLVVTVVLEQVAIHSGRWSYADSMPIVPLLGVGIVPIVQWLIVPLIVLWLTRRHLQGQRGDR